MYIAIATRPDILHSVNKLSQFNSHPHKEHLASAKHILRYLSHTSQYSLHFQASGSPMVCFSDSDWAGGSDDRKSYTGYVFIMASTTVSYESKKQQTVALSSTEAEYMAISAAAKEVIYLRGLLKELGFEHIAKDPTIMNGDNISAQQLVRNPVFHARSKHIDVKIHHVREIYKKGEIDMRYVPTTENAADIFTKILPKTKFKNNIERIGIAQT